MEVIFNERDSQFRSRRGVRCLCPLSLSVTTLKVAKRIKPIVDLCQFSLWFDQKKNVIKRDHPCPAHMLQLVFKIVAHQQDTDKPTRTFYFSFDPARNAISLPSAIAMTRMFNAEPIGTQWLVHVGCGPASRVLPRIYRTSDTTLTLKL